MRSKIILFAALLMGIATTVLFFDYMQKFKEAPAAANGKLKSVLAAKQDIPENTIITTGMLEVVQVPDTGAQSSALANPAAAEGKVAAVHLVPGEVVLPHHLKEQKEEALFVSKKVREGYRAVSVGVNIVQSVSNLIEPGDHVDLVYSKKDKATESLLSQVLLEDVPVLAIGRRMVEAQADTPYTEYAQVTLELKPADAVKAINADEDADAFVSLMLHSRIVDGQGTKQEQKKP
ncbi:Flp pilus assembly protein CpaB [Cohnella pontilimi]|uniref:Flp pilus assembly protein CpaB n=1 Tax=Cohnella pontilimi TaxID=2564100 RepID=A0A4U0F7N0_9BACL|nr:Flp pilus assembly protein CpaB [Cohnella pontilimi]TJY40727.1 Flp pilus assembly protein CpaB [Cohnella pontilimi]